MIEYNSLIGNFKKIDYHCGETYYEVADRLGAPYNSQPIVCIRNGEPVLRKDWDKPLGMAKDQISFVQIPRGGGSGMLKNILRTIALIALAVAVPYLGIPAMLGVGAGIGANLINAGIILAGTFLINAFMTPKAPALSNNTSLEASPTYSLGASGNQARLLNPIPRLYGTHILYPDFASQPYQSYENNEQYLYQLFCLGVGEYDLKSISIAETELWNSTSGISGSFNDVELEIIPPGNSVTLFPSNVISSAEVSGQELRNEPALVSVTISGNRVTFTESLFKVEYLAPGDKMLIVYPDNTPIGVFTITDLDVVGKMWIEFNTIFPTQSTPVVRGFILDGWVGPFVANPSNRATNQLKIDVVLPRGLFYANDEGGYNNDSLSYIVQIRPINNLGVPLSDYVTVLTETITLATPTPQRFTKTIDVSLGRYEVRMQRTDGKEHDSRYGNDLNWQSLRAFIPDDNTYEDVTLLAMKIRASNQLSSQSSTQVNTVQTAKIPVWNGSTWSGPQATASPAWAAADVLRNTVYGAGMADESIDLAKLLDLDATYTARGDKFNGVFDTTQTLWEALSSVLASVRTQPILVAGVVTFVRDQPRSLARTVITPQSILKNSFETTHIQKGADSADDVIVEFLDENTWEETEVQCTLPGSTSSQPARIKIFGVTNISQAWREGMYYAASNSYRRVLATVSTECDGRLLLKGDPVIVSHDMLQWSQSGYVMDYLSLEKSLIVDRPVIFDDTNQNYISLRRKDGKEFGPIEVSSNGYENEIVLDSASLNAAEISLGLTLAEVLSIDDEAKRTTFIMYDSERYKKKFLVVGSTMRDMNKVDLSLAIDDPRVYSADTGIPPEGVSYLGPGVIPDGPSMGAVSVYQSPSSLADPVTLIVSWAAATGATRYVSQYSYDNISWVPAYNGIDTSYVLVVNSGEVYIRTAAIGSVLGPWSYINPMPQNFGTPSLLPGTVSDLNVEASVTTGTLEISYNVAARASSYEVRVYTESVVGSGTFDTLELTKNTSGNFVSFVSSEVIAAGGAWSRIQVNVYSINVNGYSTPAIQQVLDISLDAITGLALTNPYGGVEASIQWNIVSGANSYRVKIYNNVSILVREISVSTNSYYYSNDQLTSDGGPWGAFSVKVNAEASALIGPQSTLNIVNPAYPTLYTPTSTTFGFPSEPTRATMTV